MLENYSKKYVLDALSDFVIDVIINDIVSQINNFQAMLQASRSDRKILAHFFHNT
jgi:hypothetical protein